MPTSLSSSARRNVRGQVPVSTRSGTSTSLTNERPLEAFSTSSAVRGATPGLDERRQPLARGQDVDGEERVVHRLERVARADRSHVLDPPPERPEHRPGPGEGSGVARHHHRERAGLRAVGAAAHRRVGEGDAALREPRGDPPRRGRIARGAVEEERAGPEPGEQAVGPVEQRGDVAPRCRRQVMTTSAAAAASRGVAAAVAPWRAANSAARAAVRFQTVSGPRRARWAAIGAPMAPRPRKPTCIERKSFRGRTRRAANGES